MRTRLVLTCTVAVTIITVSLWASAHRSTAEQEVGELEQKVNAAYAANDLPLYFSFYAPELSQWFPEGRTDLATYQKDWTSFIRNGGRIEAVQISDLHIQIGPSEDAAVASYLLRVKTRSERGEVIEEENQETDVLFKRGGVWKIVFLHYSPAAKKTAH